MVIETVIVMGARGMLGTYVVKYFKKCTDLKVVQVTREIIDANSVKYDELNNFLKGYDGKTTCVINCVGVIPQRVSEKDKVELYYNVNGMFPHALNGICCLLDIQLIHITTDCVFSGLNGISSELSPKDASTLYAKTKIIGEPSTSCNIRTSIIGEELYNKKSLLEWVKSNKNNTISGFTSHLWNGITCLQLSKIIHHMISNNIFWQGTRHIFTPQPTLPLSKFDIITLINNTYNLNITIIPTKTELIDKRLNTIYPIFYEIAPLKDQIEELSLFDLQE